MALIPIRKPKESVGVEGTDSWAFKRSEGPIGVGRRNAKTQHDKKKDQADPGGHCCRIIHSPFKNEQYGRIVEVEERNR